MSWFKAGNRNKPLREKTKQTMAFMEAGAIEYQICDYLGIYECKECQQLFYFNKQLNKDIFPFKCDFCFKNIQDEEPNVVMNKIPKLEPADDEENIPATVNNSSGKPVPHVNNNAIGTPVLQIIGTASEVPVTYTLGDSNGIPAPSVDLNITSMSMPKVPKLESLEDRKISVGNKVINTDSLSMPKVPKLEPLEDENISVGHEVTNTKSISRPKVPKLEPLDGNISVSNNVSCTAVTHVVNNSISPTRPDNELMKTKENKCKTVISILKSPTHFQVDEPEKPKSPLFQSQLHASKNKKSPSKSLRKSKRHKSPIQSQLDTPKSCKSPTMQTQRRESKRNKCPIKSEPNTPNATHNKLKYTHIKPKYTNKLESDRIAKKGVPCNTAQSKLNKNLVPSLNNTTQLQPVKSQDQNYAVLNVKRNVPSTAIKIEKTSPPSPHITSPPIPHNAYITITQKSSSSLNCQQCGHKFQTCKDFNRHLALCNEERLYISTHLHRNVDDKWGCRFCDATYTSLYLCSKHMENVHSHKLERNGKYGIFKCQACDHTFTEVSVYVNHWENVHEGLVDIPKYNKGNVNMY